MSTVRLALLSWALLLCVVAGGTQTVFCQATARPAPTATPADTHASGSETLVDSSLPADAAVDKMLGAYSPRVRALDQVIGKLKGDLKKGGIGSGSLGNFVTDAMRAQAAAKLGKPIVLAVTNSGGLRRGLIPEGELRVRDLFELMPFENALVAFDLTGAQILKLLGAVVSFRDAQSGARITYRIGPEKRAELEEARLLVDGKEKDIDAAAIYTVISIDYLWKRRSSTPSETEGNYSSIFTEAKNITPLGLTFRDALINYIKAETAAGRVIKSAIDGRFVFDKAASGTAEEPKP